MSLAIDCLAKQVKKITLHICHILYNVNVNQEEKLFVVCGG